MRIMFFGDVMGRAGRSAIINELQNLRSKHGADFVIINGENASSGLGLSTQHAMDILSAGADCITLGDHAFDQKDMMQFIEKVNGKVIIEIVLCNQPTTLQPQAST